MLDTQHADTQEPAGSKAPVNGQDEARIEITSGLYPLDAKEVNVPVLLDGGAIITHVWNKPTLQHHLDREEAMKRISRGVSRTEFISERSEPQANAEFYDAIILRAEGKFKAMKDGEEQEITQPFTREQCLMLGREAKHKAVSEAYQSSFEVEPEDDSPFAALFEREGTIKVRHEIGNAFVLRYILKVPTSSQRTEFSQSVQVKEKFEKKNRRSLITTVNLNKGVKLFTALFEGVEGGMVEGQSYSPEKKKEFLEAIDPLFKYLAVDCAVSSFDQARD